MLHFSSAKSALDAYQVQNEITLSNLKLLEQPEATEDLDKYVRVAGIYAGNLRRLTQIAESYACLRLIETMEGTNV